MSSSFTVADILDWTGGTLVNESRWGRDPRQVVIERPASLVGSGAKDLCFFFSRDFEHELAEARPGALITGAPFWKGLEKSGIPWLDQCAVIVCVDPYLAMAQSIAPFAGRHRYAAQFEQSHPRGVHPSAVVDPSAEIHPDAWVGPHVSIEPKVRVSAGAIIHSGCVIGARSTIGEGSVLFPNVVIYDGVQIGKRVRIHANTTIGADGFGYAPERKEGRVSRHFKIEHLAGVILGDDVEIGANSSVDRGTLRPTWVGAGTKIDNQVQIGHNATLGERCIMCGKSGLMGGAILEDEVYIGGAAGIGKIRIGVGSQVAAMSLVGKDLAPGSAVAGNPMREFKQHFQAHALLNRWVSGKRHPEKKKKVDDEN